LVEKEELERMQRQAEVIGEQVQRVCGVVGRCLAAYQGPLVTFEAYDSATSLLPNLIELEGLINEAVLLNAIRHNDPNPSLKLIDSLNAKQVLTRPEPVQPVMKLNELSKVLEEDASLADDKSRQKAKAKGSVMTRTTDELPSLVYKPGGLRTRTPGRTPRMPLISLRDV
jgi:hypothetical protein